MSLEEKRPKYAKVYPEAYQISQESKKKAFRFHSIFISSL